MKIQELKHGQLFRFGKQKNFRRFLGSELITCEFVPLEHKGKLMVFYDNCKQMSVDPDTEVEVEVNFLEPVKGYGKSYSTGIQKFEVEINGFKSNISHFLKDGNMLLYVYCIQNKHGEYVDLDVRKINGFPEVDFDKMRNFGIQILQDHISKNQSAYEHLL